MMYKHIVSFTYRYDVNNITSKQTKWDVVKQVEDDFIPIPSYIFYAHKKACMRKCVPKPNAAPHIWLNKEDKNRFTIAEHMDG